MPWSWIPEPGAPAQPAFPGSPAPDQGLRVVLPPFNFPPRGCLPIDKGYGPDGAAPGTSTPLTPNDGTELFVPKGYQLRIAHFGIVSIDAAGTVFSSYSILVNGSPVQSYSNIAIAVGDLQNMSEVTLQVAGPATVTVVANNGFPGTIMTYTARLQGWIYSEVP